MSAKPVAVVTGAAGFIGSHMVDLLISGGYRVRGLDDLTGGRQENLAHHANNPDFELDVRDIRTIPADDTLFRGARYVFHFAGRGDIVPSIEKPVEYMSINVMGTISVLEAARNAGVSKFVYAASSSCYGRNPPEPTREDVPISPEYPYALSKFLGEQAVLHWGRVYGIPVSSVRIFNAYGPRVKTTGAYGAVFGVFLAQKLAGKPLTVVGDGTQRRDFVFVTDVTRAFFRAAESGSAGAIYNLGTANPQTVNRLVELIGGPVVHVPKRPGEPDCTWADTSKIRRELDWEPLVSFEKGVAQMIANIDYWKNAPVWDPESIRRATQTWFDRLGKTGS